MSQQGWTGLEFDDCGRPTWLTPGLEHALAHPGDDPVGAVLAAMRLIRSGSVDADGRLALRDRLLEWLDDGTCERVAIAAEGLAQAMLDFLHAWVRSDPEADSALEQEGWASDGRWPEGEVAPDGNTARAGDTDDGADPPALRRSAWELIIDRDDAESLAVALTEVVLATKREGPAFWERRTRERLEGPDRVAEALGVLLARQLQEEAAPSGAGWVRQIASEEPACWWLDAVLRSNAIQSALLPEIAARREAMVEPALWRLAGVEFRDSAYMSSGTGVSADERIAAGEGRVLLRHAVSGLENDEVVVELRAVAWSDDGPPDRHPGLVVGFASDTNATVADVQVRPVLSSPPVRSEANEAWWIPLEGDVPSEMEIEIKVRIGERETTIRLPLHVDCVRT